MSERDIQKEEVEFKILFIPGPSALILSVFRLYSLLLGPFGIMKSSRLCIVIIQTLIEYQGSCP